tara:strand:- start:121 stop:1026 length:906 start_codon:yes stop_codon:yes gene_type:complete
MHLILGSAQLGLNYGFSKKLYKSEKKINQILSYAYSTNIKYLDTARVYGIAEKNIGKYNHKNFKQKIKVITKLTGLQKVNPKNLEYKINESIISSLISLKQKKIDIILIHNFNDFKKHKFSLIKNLIKLQKKGLLNEIGASVYSPQEAIKYLKIKTIKHLQIPFNLIDHRWLNSNFLKELSFRPDIKIHARSIFLQGLLLKKVENWPRWFKNKSVIDNNLKILLDKFRKKNKIDLCMSYVKSFNWIDFIVIGVDNLIQLKKIIKIFKNKKLNKSEQKQTINLMRGAATNRILLPYLWNKKN